jgi:hypothetical protein
MELSELNVNILVIEFINKLSLLSYRDRREFLELIKQEFRAFDDEFSVIFDNLIELLSYERDLSRLESSIISFVEIYKLDNQQVCLCIEAIINYLNDFMV